MNALVGNVFFDTCTLWNFAVVRRLDLLETRYGWRARWTEAVQYEVQQGYNYGEAALRGVLDATWLGEPVQVDDNPKALRAIELIRRALGGSNDEPLKHLGEAEIFYHLETREPTGILITDDGPALDFAKNRRIAAINTSQILAECYSQDEIGCPAAYDLIVEMDSLDRGVKVPSSHMMVCP